MRVSDLNTKILEKVQEFIPVPFRSNSKIELTRILELEDIISIWYQRSVNDSNIKLSESLIKAFKTSLKGKCIVGSITNDKNYLILILNIDMDDIFGFINGG